MDKHDLLLPPIQFKDFMAKDEIILINGVKNRRLDVTFKDSHFESLPKFMDVPVEDLFRDAGFCHSVKAVFFTLVNWDNTSAPVDLTFRQMVYEEVWKRKCQVFFLHPNTIEIMSILLAANVKPKPGDLVLICLGRNGKFCFFELRRKPEGYSYIGFQKIVSFNTSISDMTRVILASCNPNYVLVCDSQNNGLAASLKSQIVPSKNVLNIDFKNIHLNAPLVLKTIFYHGYNELIPFCMDALAVTNDTNLALPKYAVITVEKLEELPLKKYQIVPRSKYSYYVAYLDKVSGRYKHAGKAQQSKEQGHRIKLALVVDRNSLPFLYQGPFIIPEIQALTQNLTSQANLNVPFIVFFDNSSVICVRDETGYRFLKLWNGLYGNELYLRFDQKEPSFVGDITKVRDKDPFVVYDLIKILSMPADGLKIDPKWGFKVVTNDPENPVLLSFETFFGKRMAATPVYLMAILLNHHINAIMKEIGKKPTKLAFSFFNDFNDDEKNRIQRGVQEACKLLKICFVIVDHL